jgi:predicted phosphate transport protein (TIGR00153 family)
MDKFPRRKDFNYFDSFAVSAHFAMKAAEYLHGVLTAFDLSALPEQVAAMHQIENEADMSKHEMLKHLSHEVMTPIEREDIVSLAQQLDNVVDAVEEVLRRVYMFNVTAIRREMLDFTELIVKCCRALATAVGEFRNFKKSRAVLDHIVTVNTIESDGDMLFSQSMRRLYTEETDTRSLLVWSTMFDCFEHCLDACEHAADVIEGVIMKNT